MALVVEDGTGLPNANSYVSVVFADDYVERFYPDEFSQWDDLTGPRKEALLIQAAKFLDNILRWNSQLLDEEQSLNFPRIPFRDINGRLVTGVPSIIQESQVRLTIESLNAPLYTPQSLIRIDTYGNSSQTYFQPKVDGNGVLIDVKQTLLNLAYGVSQTSIVELERA